MRSLGRSLHAVRAAVTAMQNVFRRILDDGGVHRVQDDIVSVEEIFRLQRMEEVQSIVRRFLR